jgi:hypothetical protein
MAEVKFSEAARAAQRVREAVAELRAQATALETERDTVRQRIDDLRLLPLAPEDVKQFMSDTIDRCGDAYMASSGLDVFVQAFAFPRGRGRAGLEIGVNPDDPRHEPQPVCIRDLEQADRDGVGRLGSLLGERVFDVFAKGSMGHSGAFCFFFGDLLKQRIADHFDRLFPRRFNFEHVPGADETLASRRTEIAANLARIAGLETQITNVRSQLRELEA